MLDAVCILRYKDKNNKIVSYKLKYPNGQIVDISANELKVALSTGKLSVENLQLTSNGRLMLDKYSEIECRTFDISAKPVVLDRKLIKELDFEGSLSFKPNADIEQFTVKAKLIGLKIKQLNTNLFVFSNNQRKILVSQDSISIKDARDLFADTNFTIINLEGVNISSAVTSMHYMFDCCKKLETVDFSGIDTSQVTSVVCMFRRCACLKEINFGDNFKTTNVRYMSHMFFGCSKLENIDLSEFNTHYVESMDGMFGRCLELKHINFGCGFTTDSVTNMEGMFEGCISLESLDLSNFKTHNVTDMSHMFCDCASLKGIKLGGFDTRNLKRINGMFDGCKSLKDINISSFNLHNVEDNKAMELFKNCKSLESMDLRNVILPDNIKMDEWFSGCECLRTVQFGKVRPSNMYATFANCERLETIDISKIDGRWLYSLTETFAGCISLRELDLSNLYTPELMSGRNMFKGCTNLGRLDISNLDTSNVDQGYLYSSIEERYKNFEGCWDNCDNLKDVKAGPNLVGQALCQLVELVPNVTGVTSEQITKSVAKIKRRNMVLEKARSMKII